MKKLSILLLFAVLFISCEKDNGVVPEKLKEEVLADLKGKVFTAYEAQMFSESTGAVMLEPNQGYFTKMEFVGSVIEMTSANGTKSRYGFEINNANRGSTELPDIFTLAMKSNFQEFYIFLSRDYTNATVTLSDAGKRYSVSLMK
ncbi:hypothetical protein [Sphingobacterium sp.]|uniref:hypothetical protein n=1 Tax=Sphingobacterium sp. TaxID=341027 RepID=UPI0028A9C087|nr:hypothetical protein [Sphingobacterium sp.]